VAVEVWFFASSREGGVVFYVSWRVLGKRQSKVKETNGGERTWNRKRTERKRSTIMETPSFMNKVKGTRIRPLFKK
jgi:hypothetical protein